MSHIILKSVWGGGIGGMGFQTRSDTNQVVVSLSIMITYEPPGGKTNNVVSEQVRHKPTCTVTEKLEISDLSRRGIVLSE